MRERHSPCSHFASNGVRSKVCATSCAARSVCPNRVCSNGCSCDKLKWACSSNSRSGRCRCFSPDHACFKVDTAKIKGKRQWQMQRKRKWCEHHRSCSCCASNGVRLEGACASNKVRSRVCTTWSLPLTSRGSKKSELHHSRPERLGRCFF